MIEVEHLSKVYGSTPRFGCHLGMGRGCGFFGSQAGKLTMQLAVLATSGMAQIAGYDIRKLISGATAVGYCRNTPPLLSG